MAREQEVNVDMVRVRREHWISLQPIPLTELSISEQREDIPHPGRSPEITTPQIDFSPSILAVQIGKMPISSQK